MKLIDKNLSFRAVLLLLLLLIHLQLAGCCRQRTSFQPILTSNCVSPAYQQRLKLDDRACALRCGMTARCRAFAMEPSLTPTPTPTPTEQQLCLLFSFDACSSEPLLDPDWSTSGCASRRLRVFVKQSEGLEPGRLCPSDYRWVSGGGGSRFKGSLYKAAGNGLTGSWSTQAARCRSFLNISDGSSIELTKLADLSSVEELNDVRSSMGLRDDGDQVWVSAAYLSNGSWAWTDCGWPLPKLDISAGGMWISGGPNNNPPDINLRARIVQRNQSFVIDDNWESNEYIGACECFDPFSFETA